MEKNNHRFLADYLLKNVEHEFSTNIKVLNAVPDDKKNYKPDPASKTAFELAWHIASSDLWFLQSTINGKFASGEGGAKPPAEISSMSTLVGWYQREFSSALEKAKQLSDEQLRDKINFMNIYNFERVYYLGVLLHHSIHHRGQLSAYLRAMGSKVPSIYGGSHDEPFNASK